MSCCRVSVITFNFDTCMLLSRIEKEEWKKGMMEGIE